MNPVIAVVVQSKWSSKFRCLEQCNRLLDCVGVNIGNKTESEVQCHILQMIPHEADKVMDDGWELLIKETP